jgi:hypothetical protein
MINIFDHCIKKFPDKDIIVKQLIGFKDKRNDFVHNLLSSRIDPYKFLSGALRTGSKLLERFDNINDSSITVDITTKD